MDLFDEKWEQRYIDVAHLIATHSKDPSTKCGAVIVRPNRTLCSAGYNGFPMGVEDSEHLLEDRDEKLARTIHAEVNAIINSNGSSVEGCTLFVVPLMPCAGCAAQIIQSGIVRVIYDETASPEQLKRWENESKIARVMFAQKNVEYRKFRRQSG